MNALETEGLRAYYGKSQILHGVGLRVGKGEIVTVTRSPAFHFLTLIPAAR